MHKNSFGFILAAAVLISMIFCSACFAAEQVPQGNSGIASKYPGDVGIENDPAVVFTEDFETGTIEQVGQRWGAVKQGRPWGTLSHPEIMSFTDNTPDNSAGKRSLLINAIVDMDVIGTNDTGGYLFTTFEDMDKAYLRFYTKFGLGHGYEHHFVMLGCNKENLPWPYPKAGTSPKGDDHMYVYIDPLGFHGKYPPPGLWCLYSYWAEMKISADNNYWGNVTKPIDPVPVTPGKWQCVELMIKMNSAPDKRDGEFALWIDGKLSMHVKKGIPRGNWSGMGFDLLESGGEPFEGLLLRTDMNLKINTLWLEHLTGYGAQKANNVKKEDVAKINPVYFDNIVVAKSYIGPIASKKTARDHSPTDTPPSDTSQTCECDNWQTLHPEWIFCDDFETEQDLSANYDDSRYGKENGMAVTTKDPFSGSYSLEQHYAPGKPAGWILKFVGDNPHLASPGQKLNEIYFRFYHKFEEGFTEMPQKMARVKVQEKTQGWGGALGIYQWVNKKILCADKRTYLYDQKKFKWPPVTYSTLDFSDTANIGRWICIEVRIKLNTPGKSDGIIQYWADGKQILLDTDLPLGNESSSKGLNMVMWDCYWAGKSPKEQSRFYDNLVISTAPIGPIKK